MKIRRSARVIVGLTGVVLIWYALTTGILDPKRRSRGERDDDGPVLAGLVTLDGGPVEARVEVREAPLTEPALSAVLELPFGRNSPAASVTTNPEGEFQFSDVPAGRYEVTAIGPDGATARIWTAHDPDAPGPPLVLSVETGTRVLAATARMTDGAAFDGYVVAYTRGDPEDPEGTWTPAVQPDSEGSFEIHGFPRDRVCLAFVVPERLRVLRPAVDMSGGVMVVDRGLAVREGVVRDASGRGIPGARVIVRSRSGVSAREAVHAAITDDEGRYRARVLLAPEEWVAIADGFETAAGEGLPDGPIVLRRAR